MPFLTTISSTAPTNTNVVPVPFTITFAQAVNNLEFADVTVVNGSIVRLEEVSSTVWIAQVNPSAQGSAVSVSLLAGVATGPGPGFETNAASNTLTRTFRSIRPLVTVQHNIKPVTNLSKLGLSILFDRDVTGFTAADLTLVNASVYSFSGSGALYQVKITPTKQGEVEVMVTDGAATDLFGNLSRASQPIIFSYDNTNLDDKKSIVYGEVDDKDTLLNFDVKQLRQVATVTSLADCAKTIPQRLLDMATQKAFDLLRKNEDIKKLAGLVSQAQATVETVQSIADRINAIVEEPETFLNDILAAKGLTGAALQAKIEGIVAKYPGVSNINSLIEKALTSGICGQQNFYADGTPAPKPSLTPTDVLPEKIPGVVAGVQSQRYDTSPKDNYDGFLFQIKEQLEIDNVQEQSIERGKMMSVLTTLVMGYHDRIAKTTDTSQDAKFKADFEANVADELVRNADWPQDIKDQFEIRTDVSATLIQNNADVIRIFFNRNTPTSGEPVSVGVTTYSGPDKDFTTFLDIKPSERPADLTRYWEGQGKDIKKNEANLAGRGIKTGTLSYADAYRGAYGALESDFTCASSRFPGGSVLLLKNPDGTVYNPTGRNTSGLYKVTDTGNAKLTYQKPDIFTSSPELYKNTSNVQVYLVSRGTQTGPQYRLAQERYGNGSAIA